ncbi:hypothetical protein Cgig2_026771 [Carnegiea gigantea]|uniref:Uncharacterized protein n=1 Tax=Carnegiea gigantea TaxID=171969 RepID=A0A9Q1JFP5_9CARY|nr:hypothetical protein Cgig2_026771 [Carnegiea gigantea]
MECKKAEERKEFSAFINNFHMILRSSSRFGFIHFWNRGDAIKSILMVNNATIRGEKNLVFMACYEKRRPNQPPIHQSIIITENNKTWKRKKQNQESDKKIQLVRFSQESQSHDKLLIGHVNSEFKEWLSRSLVRTSDKPRHLSTLAFIIIKGFGHFKFILIFATVELMEETLRNHGELDLWFNEINKWSRYKCCETRKKLDPRNQTRSRSSPNSRTWFRPSSRTVQNPRILGKPILLTPNSNDEVPGFKHLEDDMAVDNEDGEALQETLGLHFNSNSSQSDERPLGKGEHPTLGFEKEGNYEANYLNSASTNPTALESNENQLDEGELHAQNSFKKWNPRF